MIKKRNLTNGVNANVSLEPTAASQSNSNINNNIFINKRDDGKEDAVIITRDVDLDADDINAKDVKLVILETYAKILLDQDKALLSNLIFKSCIIVPCTSLQEIIKSIINCNLVEIFLDEDIKCCASKANPIRKISAIKIHTDNDEIVTDFKTVYNKEYNELVNNYHLCLKYAVNA